MGKGLGLRALGSGLYGVLHSAKWLWAPGKNPGPCERILCSVCKDFGSEVSMNVERS